MPFEQELIDKAVKIATRAAMNGTPLARLLWIPTRSATEGGYGTFVSQVYEWDSVSETLPWDK